jgi:hypothetical protein
VDGAGNTGLKSDLSPALFVGSLIVDTQAPTVSINAFASGNAGRPKLTNDRTPTINGNTTNPGFADPAQLLLEVLNGPTVVASASTNPFTVGGYGLTSISNLADGVYDVRVTAFDAAGNSATTTSSSHVEIDGTPPNLVANNAVSPSPQPFMTGTVNDANGPIRLELTVKNGPTQIGPVYVQNNAPANWLQLIDQSPPFGLLPQGFYTVTVVATDAAQNQVTRTATLQRIDGDPEVLLIQAITSPLVTNVDTVEYEVTFNLDMNNVGPADFRLVTTIPSATIQSITPVSGSVYRIAIDTGSTDGTIALEVRDNQTAEDILGRKLPQGLTSTDVYTITQFRFTQNLSSQNIMTIDEFESLDVAVTGEIGLPFFTWYRNLDADKGAGFTPIPGENDSSLLFAPFTVADLGQYYVTAEDTTTGVLITSNTTQIIESAGVPVGGLGGVALLTALSSLGGVLALRRRK